MEMHILLLTKLYHLEKIFVLFPSEDTLSKYDCYDFSPSTKLFQTKSDHSARFLNSQKTHNRNHTTIEKRNSLNVQVLL